jgi:hypothetical protein
LYSFENHFLTMTAAPPTNRHPRIDFLDPPLGVTLTFADLHSLITKEFVFNE